MLPKLAAIHPRFAEAVFRDACRLDPFPESVKVVKWLQANKERLASILKFDLHAESIYVLDLSIPSPLLDSNPEKNNHLYLTPRIEATLADAGAQVGIGQYNEARYLFITHAFATGKNITEEFRTIHLGIDLYVPTGTPIFAPLDGTYKSIPR